MLTLGSLFSGIGGLDLGLERAGFSVQWQVEINPYAQKVLKKHWPDTLRFADIRECGAHNLPRVNLIAGGFPCQDISNAGKRAGIGGKNSGLWSEFARIISELQPEYVLLENVSALLGRGLTTVLGDLAKIRYDAQWHALSAAHLGAPHIRDRIFILAYPGSARRERYEFTLGGRKKNLQNSTRNSSATRVFWEIESSPERVVDGIPSRLDAHRLRGLGNAVVPQQAEFIGRAIMDMHERRYG